ncbi:MAG: sodium-dependent bicarbonate transport family permease [bacterium]
MTSIDPVVLFFFLGLAADLLRSDLRLPPAIYEFLSVLLLLSIGLKGGVELATQSFAALLPKMVVVIRLGILLKLIADPVLRYAGRFKRVDAASIAAHYGSVSVGTFAVAMAHLTSHQVPYEHYMTLILVLLEIPAIAVGVALARGITRETRWGFLAHEVLFGKSIVLLLGGLLIGWAAGPEGVESLNGLFFDLFKGVLALFLLEMGLICATQVGSLRRHGLFLVGFGVGMPLFGAAIGSVVGWLMDLSPGGTALLATLSGSASYIAVPAAMRLMVPESNPALSLGASLGVTFPFNVTLGIPLYLQMARLIHGMEV